MLETTRKAQPARIASVGVEISKNFVHTAEFGVQHFLRLRLVEVRQNAFGPLREFGFGFQRVAVAGKAISVAQASVDFVQHIPRRPQAV